MGMTEIGVHTGRMGSDVQSLRSSLKKTRNDVEQLRRQMEQLNTMWTGEANNAMRQRFQLDYESMTSLCNFLEALINDLESAQQSYDRCEDNVSSAVRALSIY